jgi:hypothetical protein
MERTNMSLQVYNANAVAHVLKEAGIFRDWIAFGLNKANDGKVHQVAVVVEVTDFQYKDVTAQQNSGQEASTIWTEGKQPASFLWASPAVNMGNEIIRNATLSAWAAYLHQSYFADQKNLVTRVTFQHTVDGHTWNHIFNAFYNSKDGQLSVKAEKPIQRA